MEQQLVFQRNAARALQRSSLRAHAVLTSSTASSHEVLSDPLPKALKGLDVDWCLHGYEAQR